MTSIKPAAVVPTAAQIRTNHERAEKAAVKLSTHLTPVHADCQPGKLAVLVVEAYNLVRYQTKADQTIGTPVNYSNQYSSHNMGTMCWGVDEARKTQGRRMNVLRQADNRVLLLREELAAAEAGAASLRAELGL